MTPIERHQRIGMLQAQASAARSVRLLSLFEREPQRVHSFTLEAAGLCLDGQPGGLVRPRPRPLHPSSPRDGRGPDRFRWRGR